MQGRSEAFVVLGDGGGEGGGGVEVSNYLIFYFLRYLKLLSNNRV
jgi:hypothetical protein